MGKREELDVAFVTGTEIYAGLLADAGLVLDTGLLLARLQNTLVSSVPEERSCASVTEPSIATCQWIDGDPHWSDSCKCGVPAVEGTAWCETHLSKIFEPPKSEIGAVSPLAEGSLVTTASQVLEEF